MKHRILILALLVAGAAHAGTSGAPTTATAVTLPADVVAARAVVSADLAAAATARAKLIADVAANNSSALAADIAAYKAARLQTEADMQALRTAAQSIVQQDEANLLADRILLEIDVLTNDAAAHAGQLTQLETDRAQAEANRQAIFGNLCPTGYICGDGGGRPGGEGPGRGRGR